MIENETLQINDPSAVEAEMDTHKIITLADIYRALRDHPSWASEIRKILLSHDLLELPKKFDEFIKNDFKPLKEKFDDFINNEFKPLKEKVDRIEGDVEVLKQDVAVLKQDVSVLKQDVAVLKQDVAVLKQDVEILKQDVAVLKQDVAILKRDVKQLKDDMGTLKGDVLEFRVRYNIGAFLGKILKKVKVVDSGELADVLYDAAEKGIITESEAGDGHLIDIVAEGFMRKGNSKKVLIALEVSNVGDANDLERASRRAEIISKAYELECIPMILAKSYTEGAIKKSQELGIVML